MNIVFLSGLSNHPYSWSDKNRRQTPSIRASSAGHEQGINNARPVKQGPQTRDRVNSLSCTKIASAFFKSPGPKVKYPDFRYTFSRLPDQGKMTAGIVLQGKGKKSSREDLSGVIKRYPRKRFRKISFYRVMRK